MLPKTNSKSLGALAVLLTLAACKRQAPPGSDTVHGAELLAGAARPSNSSHGKSMLPAQELTWDYPETELGPMRVVVLIPEREASARLPVLVAAWSR